MKRLLAVLVGLPSLTFGEQNAPPLDDLIILDAFRVENLGITLATADEADFEETVFAIGHIEVLPGKRAVVSSRIPGRAFSVLVIPDQEVTEGDEVLWVESRQPGDPPPTTMLAAPMSGLISTVNTAPGQPVSPDDTLVEIVDLDVVEAAAQVPESLAGALKQGLHARIRVPAVPDTTFDATLAHLGAFADHDSGTVEASFHVSNTDHRLRPGMRAEFSIATHRRESVMAIPREALQGDPGNHHAYVADFELENAFRKIPVKTGARNDSLVEITSGLLPGDEVVVRGAYMLGFAGKGNVSLKEALDAAHGHAHNGDGTEMTAEQLEEAGHHEDGEAHHDHGNGSLWNPLSIFLAASNGLFAVLLLLKFSKGRNDLD